jgi:excisionase family DNA binding protein
VSAARRRARPSSKRRWRKPRRGLPNRLRTQSEAADRLGISIRTLNAHVAAGRLRYVSVGHGRIRQRKMFT